VPKTIARCSPCHLSLPLAQAHLNSEQQKILCGGSGKLQLEFVYGGVPETLGWTNATYVATQEYPSLLQAIASHIHRKSTVSFSCVVPRHSVRRNMGLVQSTVG